MDHFGSVLVLIRIQEISNRSLDVGEHGCSICHILSEYAEAYLISDQTYGSPRIHKQLQEEGLFCSRNWIARLIQKHRLMAVKTPRRVPVTTKQCSGARTAPILLNRDFIAQAPNQKWVTEITYIDTGKGWLYLAVVIDLYSRRIVGWAMSERIDTRLVDQALNMALLTRCPDPGLLHHSDQGSQYTSDMYLDHLDQHHWTISMSRTGDCYDNAVAESFFATLKAECARSQFSTRAEARTTNL